MKTLPYSEPDTLTKLEVASRFGRVTINNECGQFTIELSYVCRAAREAFVPNFSEVSFTGEYLDEVVHKLWASINDLDL